MIFQSPKWWIQGPIFEISEIKKQLSVAFNLNQRGDAIVHQGRILSIFIGSKASRSIMTHQW